MRRVVVVGFSLVSILLTTGCGGEIPNAPMEIGSVANDIQCDSTYADVSGLQATPLKGAYLRGNLGCMDPNDFETAAKVFAADLTHIMGGTNVEATPRVVTHDEMGSVHMRMSQVINGRPLVGTELILHADGETGRVNLVNGEIALGGAVPEMPNLSAQTAIARALAHMPVWEAKSEAELVYLATDEGQVLAWAQLVKYNDGEDVQLDKVFASAHDGELLARHPQIHSAKARYIYTSNGTTTLPGTLLISEGGSSGDAQAQSAYNGIGLSYDYYMARFGRDSFNGSGANLFMSVHYGNAYNNAFWNGAQMAFGDGDGSLFGPFAFALDVVGHELTHAVTERTAGLIYMNESGALNEAMSDIFGAGIERYAAGGVTSANTWKVGEDCYTPATANDAMRYMNDPTADGYSYDFYPERYTGAADQGGVHLNSGIANLAFHLMSVGGSHPRGKTTVPVSAIGFNKAEQIFYRALTIYMTPNSGFEDAKAATMAAAVDLYGTFEVNQVQNAWAAVGVSTSTASFNTSTALGYAPLTVQFTDTTAGATNWSWLFGDGYTSTQSSPVHTYDTPGTYLASLNVDGSVATKQIRAAAKPHVDFGSSVTRGTRPVTVQFDNYSSGTIYGYTWDFGDGVLSNEVNPEHTYLYKGTYTVKLIANGEAGPVEVVKEQMITVKGKNSSDGDWLGLGCHVTNQGTTPSAGFLGLIGLLGAALIWRRRKN